MVDTGEIWYNAGCAAGYVAGERDGYLRGLRVALEAVENMPLLVAENRYTLPERHAWTDCRASARTAIERLIEQMKKGDGAHRACAVVRCNKPSVVAVDDTRTGEEWFRFCAEHDPRANGGDDE